MSTRTTDYLDAIDHLPEGATLVFNDVSWDEYEIVVEGLAEKHVRVSYDCGRLEVVSPGSEHEYYIDLIRGLMRVVAEELHLEIEGYGSTTWKRKRLRKGAEPDACFYVATARRLRDRLHIDLETDPPPDIIVEIESTNESSGKFPIYAALQVPEIWKYDGKAMQFYLLSETTYLPITRSRCIPQLSPTSIEAVLKKSKTEGQTAALREFRVTVHEIQSL